MKPLLMLALLTLVGCSTSSLPADPLPYCQMAGIPEEGGIPKAVLPIYNAAYHAGEDPEWNVLRVTMIDTKTQRDIGRAIVMAARGWETWPIEQGPCGDGVVIQSEPVGKWSTKVTCAAQVYTRILH